MRIEKFCLRLGIAIAVAAFLSAVAAILIAFGEHESDEYTAKINKANSAKVAVTEQPEILSEQFIAEVLASERSVITQVELTDWASPRSVKTGRGHSNYRNI